MSSRVPARVIPWRSASKVERWMVGPSASGSLKGTPTSIMSATSSAARRAAALASGVGYPAVRYGMRAVRPFDLRALQVEVSADSDEVIANCNPIAGCVGNLDDGPLEC